MRKTGRKTEPMTDLTRGAPLKSAAVGAGAVKLMKVKII